MRFRFHPLGAIVLLQRCIVGGEQTSGTFVSGHMPRIAAIAMLQDRDMRHRA